MEARFGPEIVSAVDAVTRRDGEAPESYYQRFRANPDALIVKAVDLHDNSDPTRLALLPPEVADQLVRKHAKAKELLGL